jgi:phosphoglycolate phosphatase-like HAD superfamily hydrolase
MRLLLFDIDGTLLQVNGGVHQAIIDAVSTVTDRTVSTDGISFSGRTDPNIFRDVLHANGVPEPNAVLETVLTHYVDAAQDSIRPDHVEPLPGVDALLSSLAERTDVVLGLVTGNVEPIAYHKLRGAGLATYFSVGAFGSDHADRTALPRLAARRAAAHTGHSFPPTRTVIIGDTRHDIRTARATGARAVAVCTGRFDRSELSPHTPDFLFKNLQEPEAFVEQILES